MSRAIPPSPPETQTPLVGRFAFLGAIATLAPPIFGVIHMSLISAPVSHGELIDKITILEIKSERMTDASKLANVRDELQLLESLWSRDPAAGTDIATERAELKRINEALWEIEDEIRVKEREQTFDARFVELARAVYHTNDQRAAVKRAINVKLGSRLVEEKSYQDYGAA